MKYDKNKIRPEIQKYLDRLKEETKKDLELADKIDKEISSRWYETWFRYK